MCWKHFSTFFFSLKAQIALIDEQKIDEKSIYIKAHREGQFSRNLVNYEGRYFTYHFMNFV